MRILVLGGTGFVGPHVVQRLHAQGHAVTIFHRGQTEVDLPPGIQHLHGDRAHLPTFAERFRSFAPEVVLDMVPMTEHDARLTVDTLRGIAGRLVAISSADVYRAHGRLSGREPGPPDPVPLTEAAPLRERLYPYRSEPPRAADAPGHRWGDDYDKIVVERVVLGDPDFPGTILRLPMVYGPGDDQHRLFPYLKRMDDRRPAILLAERAATWRASRGYVENVAAAIALAVTNDRAAGRIYNVADAAVFTVQAWVEQVGAIAGWGGRIVVAAPDRLPSHLRRDGDWRQDWVVDATRARQELGGTEVMPVEEALRRTIGWERAHPPATIDPTQFDYEAEDAALAELGGAP